MKRARTSSRARSTTRTRASSEKRGVSALRERQLKKRKLKRIRFFAILSIIIIATIFILLGLGGENNSLIPVDTSTGKLNVLILGTDADGLRTDAIMIASYDFDEARLNLMSIPRDTKIYVKNKKVTRKINEIHAMTRTDGKIMGPLGSVEAVSGLTGIPINYYVEFNFDAIDHLMDILGPVKFDVPDVEGNGKGMNYDDPYQNLHIHLKPGIQELSGNQVQQFLRYRKSNNKNSDGSDTSRVLRQQDFIKALIEQKANLSLVIKAPDIFSQLKKDIKTNFSSSEIAKYATHLLKLKAENIHTYSMPGEDAYVGGGWYFVPDMTALGELIETEFGYDSSEMTTKMEITGIKYSEESVKNREGKEVEEPEKTHTPTLSPTKEPEEEIIEIPEDDGYDESLPEEDDSVWEEVDEILGEE